jgi:hypothetical protein
MKNIVILQSNYIPWKGYFDLIRSADEFILYDEVQYTKNDWRNRNQIKSQDGLHWLTIPVVQKSLQQTINETVVVDDKWRKKHFETIRQFYKKACFFREEIDFIEDLYARCNYKLLSEINYFFIQNIADKLGIKTKLTWSNEYNVSGGKTERLVNLVKAANGTHYTTGPAASAYLDTKLFLNEGIDVLWADYSRYPEYNQLYPPFINNVSILDVILNNGPKSIEFLKNNIYA